jgi:hypothetical protein
VRTTTLATDDVIDVQWFLICATVTTDATISSKYTLLMHAVLATVELV